MLHARQDVANLWSTRLTVDGPLHLPSREGSRTGSGTPAARLSGCDWQAGQVQIDLHWDHNAWYQARLLRALPLELDEVLDVGCGAGSFALRLAARARHVDAIDRAPQMVAFGPRAGSGERRCPRRGCDHRTCRLTITTPSRASVRCTTSI